VVPRGERPCRQAGELRQVALERLADDLEDPAGIGVLHPEAGLGLPAPGTPQHAFDPPGPQDARDVELRNDRDRREGALVGHPILNERQRQDAKDLPRAQVPPPIARAPRLKRIELPAAPRAPGGPTLPLRSPRSSARKSPPGSPRGSFDPPAQRR